MPGPTVGQVIDGYRFKGGNPNDRGAWEPVSAAGPSGSGAVGLSQGRVMIGPRGGVTRVGGLNTDERKTVSRAQTEAELTDTTLSDLMRFDRLQNQQGTGGALALPFARDVVGAFNPRVAEMNEITARLAPAQRQPGSGTTSDMDLRLFLQAVPGAQRPGQANRAIIDRGLQEGARRQLRAEFLEDYAAQNGSLNGSSEAWRQAYRPPPVREGTPVPRGNVEPTAAQRATINRLNQSGERNRTAVLGARANPRVPPEGFDISSLPAGDWYVAPNGRVQQVARERGNRDLRARSGRSQVVGVRRVG